MDQRWTRRGELRKTHGARACETMLEAVERTLANGLRPGEEVGRWGDDEFLVLSHERSTEVLAATRRHWRDWRGRRIFAGGAIASR